MEKTTLTQFAHVLIHYFSNKSRATTKLFISEPSKNIENSFGRIFGIVEINTPSKENSKIINQIFSDIESTYYSYFEEKLTPTQAFEKTLKQVNDDFLQIISQNTTSMVGNLNEYTIKEKINLVFGVIYDQKLIITTLNAIGAFLIHKSNQDYKCIEINKNENSNETDEVKLFYNVISGDIKPNDYLLFCNNDFLNFISKERFTKTISSLPPSKAADYFKNSLLQHDGFNFAAIIIKQTRAEEESLKEQKSLTSIHQLNSKENATEKLLSPSILPTLKANGEILKSIAKKFFTKKESKKSSQILPTVPKVYNDTNDIITANQKLKEKSSYSQSFKRSLTFYRLLKNKLNLNIKFQNFKNHLRLKFNRIISTINKVPNLSKILLIIVVISGLLFVYSIYFVNPDSLKILSRAKINTELISLNTVLDDAESKLIFGDNTNAKTLLATVEDSLKQIKIDNNQDQAYAQDVINRLNTLVAKLRKITLVNDPNQLFEAIGDVNLNNIAISKENLYIFDAKNNEIKSVNIRTKEITAIQGQITGNIASVNVNNDIIYLTTDANYFYKIAENNLISLSVTLSTDDKISDFAFYNDRLYTLIPNKNQIYRHPNADDTYYAGQTWIQESGVNIEKANSMNIDTRVWLATDDGQIIKLFKGYKQIFNIEAIEPKLDNITDMMKFDESENIYILDSTNNRVIVIDTNGALITQYYSPLLENITSFFVDENNKTLYIANANKVYTLFMTHIK